MPRDPLTGRNRAHQRKNRSKKSISTLRISASSRSSALSDTTPVPIRGSFSYAVTDGEIAETTGLLKAQGVARCSGTAPRMQCVADGEEALDYLDKRRGNMRYGWLRRNGYCISSSHVEAAARILVARRCKQAGMHWRHHNAACVCAIIARLRTAA